VDSGKADDAEHGSAVTTQNPERYFLKTKFCKFHLQGLCSRGAACGYAHHRAELKPLPDFFRTRLCPMMLQSGCCEDGDKCRYAHHKDDLRKAVLRRTKAKERQATKKNLDQTNGSPKGAELPLGHWKSEQSDGSQDDATLPPLPWEIGQKDCFQDAIIQPPLPMKLLQLGQEKAPPLRKGGEANTLFAHRDDGLKLKHTNDVIDLNMRVLAEHLAQRAASWEFSASL